VIPAARPVREVAMSIALPVRGRRPAAKSGWVWRLRERPLSVLPAVVEFVTAPVTILLGASLFTRKVQVFGGRFGLWEGAVGSGLAGGDKGEGAGDKGRTDPSAFGTPTCPLAARTGSRSNGLRTNCVLLGYGHGYPYFRAHDRGHDRPEHHHHTRDARGESGLRRRPMGEAEGRQR
jgi:hypothetical protein